MGVDVESFHGVLKHPIRRKILLALSQCQNLSYMDLMGAVEAANTGKFNYHLKVLSDLLQKDANGKYSLTEKGVLAAQFLLTFKEKKVEASKLPMADALLIGFAGFIVTIANPAFWTFEVAAFAGVKSFPFFGILLLLIPIFGLVVPGALMWKLTVRRSHSHDSYDLFKAPLLTLAMLLVLLLFLHIFQINLSANVTVQVQSASGLGYSETRATGTRFIVLPMLGLALSFVGVAVAEFLSRLRRKAASS